METKIQVKPRRMRAWLPVAIIALAIPTIMVLQSSAELPVIKKIMFTMLTIAASTVLLFVWFLFLSAFRWRTRLIALVVLGLLGVAFNRSVRVNGSANGSGLPRLTWKWRPHSSGEIKVQAASLSQSAQPVAIKASVPYPGFLGDRTGCVRGVRLDKDWAAHPPQQLWRQPVGLGWAGFAIMDNYAITLEQRGEDELVVGYELATGHTLWLHTNHVRFSEKMGGDGPRSTPSISEGRVYALGATGILDCLDLATGKSLWTRDTLKEIRQPNLIFGTSCSPLVIDDLVVVNGGETNGPTLWAYNRDTGSNVWHSGTDKASYSSPTLTTLCGKRQIVSVNAASVTGHNPADGRVLWKYDWKGWGPRCAQPVTIEGDRVFLSAGFGIGCLLLQVKTNDTGEFSAGEIWKNMRLKTQFSSAVVRGGYAYGLDEGDLACLDLATGARQWKNGHYGYGQVLLIDDLLLVQTEPGPVVLIEANPMEFHELGKFNALSSKTWNNPALAGEYLLSHNDTEAVCYRLPLRNSLVTK